MCFSASVSLTVSLALAAVGWCTLRKAHGKQELPFAAIPFLFAAQQLIEGILWLVLPRADLGEAQYWLTQSYVFFIGVVWPILVPLGLLFIEPNLTRKRIMQAILGLGVLVAIYTMIIISRYGVTAELTNQCIIYQYTGDDQLGILTVYFIATCMGFFFSSHWSIRWIGVANTIGFIIAYNFYRIHYASVWCLFAAIISGLIYIYFNQRIKCAVKTLPT